MATLQYIPGVCNIGPAEIKTRRLGGLLGLILTAVFLVLSIVLHFPPVLRLIIFIPVTLAANGYLQAYFHFCVQFGTRGLFNVGDSLGKTENVDQKQYRRLDQIKALKIIIYSLLIGIAAALLIFFLP